MWWDKITGPKMLETLTVIWGANWRRHTPQKAISHNIYPLLVLCLFFLCSFPYFHPHMSCQQTRIGNTVSNLTNGPLRYSFENRNIIRLEDTKEKESYSDVCSVYQALRSCSPKIIENTSTSTYTQWKFAYRSPLKLGLSPFPPLLMFPGLCQASFWHDWLPFPTDGPDIFPRPRTEIALRWADLRAS